MKKSLKNSSFINRFLYSLRRNIFYFLIVIDLKCFSQVICNYVNNGGFEEHINTSGLPIPKFWGATDSSKAFGELLSSVLPPYKIPNSSYTYQWPKNGNNILISLKYCPSCPYNKRTYPRNRLKQSLETGVVYCASMYVNLSNNSTHGISNLGFYFADNTVDTILKCNVPITFLISQIENILTNIITDTLNWILISGQFTANGTEKYLMIGNFYDDANTKKQLVNPTHLPANAADYLIDDVSVIATNLPAYAGPDHALIPGDSAFIGREPDVGIDEACMWYKLPNDSVPIDTVAGLWVKPVGTATYVVRQQLNCGGVKWDTVVV
jgi:hypothetical protein